MLDAGTLTFKDTSGKTASLENLGGSINVGGTGTGGTLQFDGTNATFDLSNAGSPTGTGTLTLSDNANNLITGVTGTEILVNDVGETISGAGTISNLFLENSGIIDADGTAPLNITPNSRGFTNNGTVNLEGSDLTVNGNLSNTGTIQYVRGSAVSTLDVIETLMNTGPASKSISSSLKSIR